MLPPETFSPLVTLRQAKFPTHRCRTLNRWGEKVLDTAFLTLTVGVTLGKIPLFVRACPIMSTNLLALRLPHYRSLVVFNPVSRKILGLISEAVIMTPTRGKVPPTCLVVVRLERPRRARILTRMSPMAVL